MSETMKTRNDNCHITIIDHHSEYPMPKFDNISIYQRWDGCTNHDVIESALSVLSPDAPELTDEQTFAIMHKHLFDASVPECNRLALPHNMIDLTPDWVYIDIYEIIGSIDNLKSFANVFANDVILQSNSVGGDNSYYDYFPNYCKMFYAVCHELNLKQLYIDTYNALHTDNSPYADDDNQTIAAWAD